MSTKHPLHIFVVDDEKVIAGTLAIILERSGFHVRAFTDPLEALINVDSAVPDLLITDVMMPQMSGIELAIRVKQLRPSCKILLFSGQAATASLLRQAHLEGHDFELLSKPIHPSDLLGKIREQTQGPSAQDESALAEDHSGDPVVMIVPTETVDRSVEGS